MCCSRMPCFSDLTKLFSNDEFVPCRNLHEMAVGAKPLHLVLRKKENGLFKRSSYTYMFPGSHLRDILDMSDSRSGGFTSLLLSNDDLFADVQTDGSAIKDSNVKQVDFNESSESIDMSSASADFTDLKFRELKNKDGIFKELQTQWRFDKTHRLWECITNSTEKYELAVITGLVATGTSIEVSLQHSSSGGVQSIFNELCKMFWTPRKETMLSIVIPAGAVLAYKVQPLEVLQTNGRIRLPVDTKSQSGYCGKLFSENQETIKEEC